MEPESNKQGERFDAEALARHVNEEHAETMRDLGDVTLQEQAYAEATLKLRELAKTVGPESVAEQVREVEALRDAEGYIV